MNRDVLALVLTLAGTLLAFASAASIALELGLLVLGLLLFALGALIGLG